jgi:hypothetical protein
VVGVDILSIVRAERAAEALVRIAIDHKDAAIREAIQDRVNALASIKEPPLSPLQLESQKPDLAGLKVRAKANRAAAMKYLLEEFYAS